MTRFKSAALIVNAKSRRGQALFEQACKAFEPFDMAIDAHAVEDPGKLDDTIRNALARKPELVILGGGDGTVSGLVDHLVGQNIVLGVLPLGTANSFCRTLGIPLDVDGAVDVIMNGAPRRIDLGMIDNDYFANAATMGIAPKIAETVPHDLKKYLGRAGYLGWAALQYAKFSPFPVSIDDGSGKPKLMKCVEVRIANGRYHGGQEMMDEADVDSGDIVVECVRGHLRSRLIYNWAANVLRLPQRREKVTVFRGRSIHIDSDKPRPVSIDGEVLAHTPVTAKIAAGIIEVMAPVG